MVLIETVLVFVMGAAAATTALTRFAGRDPVEFMEMRPGELAPYAGATTVAAGLALWTAVPVTSAVIPFAVVYLARRA